MGDSGYNQADRQNSTIQAIAQPAAGAEFTTVLTAPLVIQAITFKFATSAVVASRVPQIIVDDGTANTVIWSVNAMSGAITASLSPRYTGFPTAVPTGILSNVLFTIPGLIRLPTGTRIRSLTSAIDVGDQYSDVKLIGTL